MVRTSAKGTTYGFSRILLEGLLGSISIILSIAHVPSWIANNAKYGLDVLSAPQVLPSNLAFDPIAQLENALWLAISSSLEQSST